MNWCEKILFQNIRSPSNGGRKYRFWEQRCQADLSFPLHHVTTGKKCMWIYLPPNSQRFKKVCQCGCPSNLRISMVGSGLGLYNFWHISLLPSRKFSSEQLITVSSVAEKYWMLLSQFKPIHKNIFPFRIISYGQFWIIWSFHHFYTVICFQKKYHTAFLLQHWEYGCNKYSQIILSLLIKSVSQYIKTPCGKKLLATGIFFAPTQEQNDQWGLSFFQQKQY